MATALSAVMGKPIRVYNIRAGRADKPGLKAQHLVGVQLVRDFCGGTLEGGTLGSTEIVLRPRKLTAGKYSGVINTAGSISLLLQVSLPCLIFAKGSSQLVLRGGTNVQMAPTIDYIMEVMQPILKNIGIQFSVDLQKRGFFPKGQGVVSVTVEPVRGGLLRPIELVDRGTPTGVTGLAFAAGVLPIKMTHNMADRAVTVLRSYDENLEVVIDRKRFLPDEAFGNGCGILLVAKTSTSCLLGSSALLKRGWSDEDVGTDVAKNLILNLEHGGCVDDYLQDQLIIFMALADGKSRIRCGPLTLHTQTAIHVVTLMTNAQFEILRDEEDPNHVIVECQGHGFNGSLR